MAFAPSQTCHCLGSHTHEAATRKLIYSSIFYNGNDLNTCSYNGFYKALRLQVQKAIQNVAG